MCPFDWRCYGTLDAGTNTTCAPFDEIYENAFFVQKVAGMCSVLYFTKHVH